LLSQGLQKEIKWHISPAITKHIVMVSQNFLSFINRWILSIETTTLSTVRWRLDPGRFHLRPGLHVDSLHLRRDANQRTANQICLRRYWQWQCQFTCTGNGIYEYFTIGKKKKC
jgi:hypothetical protein